jgi:dolichyl-diphosphooligosaccharide--protein glycosyltransferase
MVFLWKHRTDRNVIIFAIITLVVFIIAINQRRFMYYATINIAILSAFAIFELTQLLKRKSAWNAVMIVLILVLISMPICKNMGMSRAGFMPVEWKQALEWVKNQPGSGYVTAWGDYGHWIKYVAEREPNYLPGPGGNAIADFLLTSDQSRGKELLSNLQTEYLIVDELTINQKSYALSIYAGYKPQSKQETLGYRIYYGKVPLDYLTLAYESQSIKIFKFTY